MENKSILRLCIGVLLLVLIIQIYDSCNKEYTIEKQTGGVWHKSKTNYPDTVIIDTVNIDGIVTFHTTEYLVVQK